MRFAGMQKLSLTDYPKKVAATIFTSGCNFKCEYCHNPSLLKKREGTIEEAQIYELFEKREKVLDGLVITGGEPTLYTDELLGFCSRFKKKFPQKLLKVDTNGSNPQMVKALSDVANFCAMDLKSNDYSPFSDITVDTVIASMKNLLFFEDFEIRITLFPKYISPSILNELLNVVKSNSVHSVCLQQYRPLKANEPQYFKKEVEEIVQTHLKRGLTVVYRGF